MKRRKWLLTLSMGVWLAACADTTGPPGANPPPALSEAPNHLRWAPTATPRQFALGTGPVHDETISASVAAAAAPPVLDSYATSFWAVRGQDRGVRIHYATLEGWQPYLALTIPAGALAQRPNGIPFAVGDSILITAIIDTVNLVVQLEPTGLQFNSTSPARLEFWYTGADPDLDGSGSVDATDAEIEQNRLDVWLKQHSSDPWQALVAVHALDSKWFAADLIHFSGYAVSW